MAGNRVLDHLSDVLDAMRKEARRRKAPIFDVERATRGKPFKILVFTMLSARTKDERTLKAVEALFSLADSPSGILSLGEGRIESILRPIGFFRAKTRNLMELCRMLDGGPVPDTLEGLTALKGVGRKTANIVLSKAFGKSTIGVDVHVHRMSNRLGLVKTKKPEETEAALMRMVHPSLIGRINSDLVAFGQTVCVPLRPLCGECPVRDLCPRVGIREEADGRYKAPT